VDFAPERDLTLVKLTGAAGLSSLMAESPDQLQPIDQTVKSFQYWAVSESRPAWPRAVIVRDLIQCSGMDLWPPLPTWPAH